jgi:hypothetical protein
MWQESCVAERLNLVDHDEDWHQKEGAPVCIKSSDQAADVVLGREREDIGDTRGLVLALGGVRLFVSIDDCAEDAVGRAQKHRTGLVMTLCAEQLYGQVVELITITLKDTCTYNASFYAADVSFEVCRVMPQSSLSSCEKIAQYSFSGSTE